MSRDDYKLTITQAIEEMKQKQGDSFSYAKINLAELSRMTGVSRAKLRRLKENGFSFKPHGRTGKQYKDSVLTGYTEILEGCLRSEISNSSVCCDKLREAGYGGSVSTVKRFIQKHKDLLPAKRQLIAPQGNRGRRFTTAPGEAYQMDWGFVNVDDGTGGTYQAACFAMICHHCGERFVEFFPNAKQENLFIGILHGFACMGIPKYILTDNMRSVVIGRDTEGHPRWQKDYAVFMDTVGFQTKLCKPRHPFTKGKVERLVRFVKNNFLAFRTFSNITELNFEALGWCKRKNIEYNRSTAMVPENEHSQHCRTKTSDLSYNKETAAYLCPLRKISFDGFVNYEGRRFGVPYWYGGSVCRVHREDFKVLIYSEDLEQVLAEHDVTWSRRDSYCKDQYALEQPEEFPTVPVKERIYQIPSRELPTGFERFDFEEGLEDE